MATEKATTTSDLKTETDPQPADEGKPVSYTTRNGSKVTASKAVIDKLKARNA